jgi:hypothetical protein
MVYKHRTQVSALVQALYVYDTMFTTLYKVTKQRTFHHYAPQFVSARSYRRACGKKLKQNLPQFVSAQPHRQCVGDLVDQAKDELQAVPVHLSKVIKKKNT